MSDKKVKLPSAITRPAGEDISALSFETLQTRFEASSCERDSFALASAMYAKDFHKAMKLLPINFDVYTQDPSAPAKIAPNQMDFSGDGKATSHEWSSALVAAKKLKLEAGSSLEANQVTQAIDEAKKIYIQSRKEEPYCRTQ